MNERLIQLRDEMRHEASSSSKAGYAQQGYAECAGYVANVLDSVPSRCGWFGEGRGQCLLKAEHKGIHTCEEDGRLLLASQNRVHSLDAQCAILEAEVRRLMTGLQQISDDEFITLSEDEDPSYEACYWRVVKIASQIVRFQK